MASGMGLGPVPEFEGHRLASLHARSRWWGRVGSGLVCTGLCFGAGALGRAALTDRPLHERIRTVVVNLDDGPATFLPEGEALEGGGASGAALAAGASPANPVAEALPEAPALLPHAAQLPVGTPTDLSTTSAQAGPGLGGRGLGSAIPGSGPGLGGEFRGAGHGPGEGGGVPAGLNPAATYRASLASWLAARKRYPVAARNQGRQGEVLLNLEIDPCGALAQVHLERSSGHDLLDQAALTLVKTCGALPPPPPGLRSVRVAVAYSLA